MGMLRLVPASGAPIEITKDEVLIGRDPACDIVLSDGSVSRRHARIEAREEVWAVVDQASANGTFLDSQRIADAGLRDGHELRFGAVGFTVEIVAELPDMAATVSGNEPEETVIAEAIQSPLMSPPRSAPPEPEPPPEPMGSFSPPAPPPPLPSAGAPGELGGPVPGLGAPPPSDMAPAAPPPASSKKTLLWVGGGCCGCLVLIALAVAAFMAWGWLMVEEPAAAVRAQLEEIRSGRLEEAYQRLDSDARQQLSEADFTRFVSNHPSLEDHKDATFNERSVENNNARLSGSLRSNADESEDVIYELVKQDGEWKVAAIEFGDPASGGDSLAESARLAVETTNIDKVRVRGRTDVTILVRVTGFATLPTQEGHQVDIVGDLETRTPDGQRIDDLSKQGFHRWTQTLPPPVRSKDFETVLGFSGRFPGGTYTTELAFRDLIGRREATHLARFDLP